MGGSQSLPIRTSDYNSPHTKKNLSLEIRVYCQTYYGLFLMDTNYITRKTKLQSTSTHFQLLLQHHLSLLQENGLPPNLNILIIKKLEEVKNASQKGAAQQFLSDHEHFWET